MRTPHSQLPKFGRCPGRRRTKTLFLPLREVSGQPEHMADHVLRQRAEQSTVKAAPLRRNYPRVKQSRQTDQR